MINTIILAKNLNEKLIVTVIQTLENSKIYHTLHVTEILDTDSVFMAREIKGSKPYIIEFFHNIDLYNYKTL